MQYPDVHSKSVKQVKERKDGEKSYYIKPEELELEKKVILRLQAGTPTLIGIRFFRPNSPPPSPSPPSFHSLKVNFAFSHLIFIRFACNY